VNISDVGIRCGFTADEEHFRQEPKAAGVYMCPVLIKKADSSLLCVRKKLDGSTSVTSTFRYICLWI
jgi:hypothetical protein